MKSFLTISAFFTIFMVSSPLLTAAGVLPEYPTLEEYGSDWWALARKCGGRNDVDGVKLLIEKYGAEQVINARAYNITYNCLQYAARFGRLEMMALLAENGADMDDTAGDLESPLAFAIRIRKYATITTLIKLGASVEKARESSVTYGLSSDFEASMEEEQTKAAIALAGRS